MGRKAVSLLLHTVLIFITLIAVLLTGLAMLGATVSPAQNGFVALLALGLPVLLLGDLIFVMFWIVRRRWWFILPLAALAGNYNYYPSIVQFGNQRPVMEDGAKALRVATYNVNYFEYEETDRTVSYIARFLQNENIDVVCFQEFMHTEEFTVDDIALALGLPYFAIGRNDTDFDDLAIFSRYPISGTHEIIFKNAPNSAMWTDIDVEGSIVRLFNAHLQTTSVNWEKDDLERQIALGGTTDQARAAIRISNIMKNNFRRRAFQVDNIVAAMDTCRMPVIFCGDCNDTPSSYTYNQLTGNGKKRTDGFRQAGKGYAYTYHLMKKTLRLDYILYSSEITGADYYSPSYEWSDHNPVLMTLKLE